MTRVASYLLLAALGALALGGCHPDDRASAQEAPAQTATAASKSGVTWSADDKRWGWLSFRTVQAGRPIATLPAPGKVAPLESSTWAVQPPLAGRADQVHVRVGQTVSAGDALLEVFSPGLADLERERTLAAQTVALRQQELAHGKTLEAAHAIAERDMLAMQQNLAAAQVDLSTAGHKLAAMNVSITGDSSYICRAPHSGVVVAASVVPGQEVGPDTPPVVTIAQLDQMVVWAQVLDADVGSVQVGETADILMPGRGDRKVEATVASIAKAVDPEQHTVGVRLVTRARADWLLPNGFVQVAFRRHEGRAIVVPSEAVVTDDLQSIVFIRHPDGRLERREVVVGQQGNGQCEIVRGLAPGETIVVKGAILLLNEVEQ